MNIVIGSGPVGIAAACTLLNSGKKVTMIDTGINEDKKLEHILRDYKQKNFDPAVNKNTSSKFAPKKIFGLSYPFKLPSFIKVKSTDCEVAVSYAKGGLSNVWGSYITPFHSEDIIDWPISIFDLHSNYAEIEKFMNISSDKDNTDKLYTFSIGKKHSYLLGKLFNQIYPHFKTNERKLNHRGIYFGRSKVAVGVNHSHDGSQCKELGLCHFGCPNRNIFSSAYLLENLKKNTNFKYISKTYVDKIEENKHNVIVNCINIETKDKISLSAEKTFVACGTVNSTFLLKKSLNQMNKPVLIKDSQRFIFPIISFRYSGSSSEVKNNLAEVFLSLKNQSISNNIIHLQLYSFNEFMTAKIRDKYPVLYKIFKILFSFMLDRLIVCVGYLHSNDSGKIQANFSNSEKISHLKFTGIKNPKTKKIINMGRRLLQKNLYEYGLLVLPISIINKIGSSYHIGSSMPMSATSSDGLFTSDTMGRVGTMKNTHVIDTSILPSVPASPTTFNTMANAIRIVKGTVNK